MFRLACLSLAFFALSGCNIDLGGSSDPSDSNPPADTLAPVAGGGNTPTPTPNPGSSISGLAMLEGVWDWSEDFGVDGYDEMYVHIGARGKATFYDYMGDSYDQGNNCYIVEVDGYYTHLGGDNFRLSDEGEAFDIVIRKINGSLNYFLPGDPNPFFVLPPANRHVSSLTPICSTSWW